VELTTILHVAPEVTRLNLHFQSSMWHLRSDSDLSNGQTLQQTGLFG